MKKSDSRELLTFLGFILPGLLLYIFIIAYPIFYSIFLSFTNYNPAMAVASRESKRSAIERINDGDKEMELKLEFKDLCSELLEESLVNTLHSKAVTTFADDKTAKVTKEFVKDNKIAEMISRAVIEDMKTLDAEKADALKKFPRSITDSFITRLRLNGDSVTDITNIPESVTISKTITEAVQSVLFDDFDNSKIATVVKKAEAFSKNVVEKVNGDWSLKFRGFGNYKTVLTMNRGIINPNSNVSEFWYAFKNNMIVVLVSVFGQIPIGFILAFILYRKQVKAAGFFQSMVFMPQFLSTIVIGIMWRLLFQVDGPVATIMQAVSGDPERQFKLLMDPQKAMIPVGIVLIWMYTGFYMIIFLANLQKINESMFEAAKIDGATEVQIFFRITIPLLAGSILTSCILAIAGSLKGFSLIFALAPEGKMRANTEVLPIYLYRISFGNGSMRKDMRYAYGAAVSNIIVLISVLLIMFSNWVGKKLGTDEEY